MMVISPYFFGEFMNLRSFLFCILFLPSFLFASEKPFKIGGDFIVKSIKRNRYNDYSIVFKPSFKSDKLKLLVLNTDHVHSNLAEGSSLRLSAEVVRVEAKIATVSQLVVFYPSKQGKTPVWMISKSEHSKKSFNASKLIDVHSPQSDYLVF